MTFQNTNAESAAGIRVALDHLPPGDPRFATVFVNAVLRAARDTEASDIHIDPMAEGLDVRWRLDGVLQPLVRIEKNVAPNVIARIKVMAGLLTYEMAMPQEGRIWVEECRLE